MLSTRSCPCNLHREESLLQVNIVDLDFWINTRAAGAEQMQLKAKAVWGNFYHDAVTYRSSSIGSPAGSQTQPNIRLGTKTWMMPAHT